MNIKKAAEIVLTLAKANAVPSVPGVLLGDIVEAMNIIGRVVAGDLPLVLGKSPDSELIATLMSTHGEIKFNIVTGEVTDCRIVEYMEKVPKWIDVDEWRKRYPGEELLPVQHDILDFGMWFDDRHHDYDGPSEDWRIDRERLRKEEHHG